MSKMIDLRCPRCNRPLYGREDVVWALGETEAQRYGGVTVCPNPECKTGVKLVRTSKAQGALVKNQYHYTTK